MAHCSHLVFTCLLVLLAASGAVAGRALLGDAPQGGKLQFVPKGCTLASVQVEAHYAFKYAVFGPRVIRGTVKLSNGNTFAVPISKVSVTLAPAVPVSPFIITASCSGGSVPSSPQPYQYGTLTCTFESPDLPTSGPAAGFRGWKTAGATATIGMSGATCSSGSNGTPIKGWILTDIFGSGPGSSSSGSGSSSGGSGVGAAGPQGAGAGRPALLGGAAAGRKLSEDGADGAAGPVVGYVPSSNDCLGMTITASASMSADGVVSGSVFITNPREFSIPLSAVRVQISNSVPVAPIFADAACQGGLSVPSNPQPFQLGTLVCSYSAAIPSEGIASDPSKWPSVLPKVDVAMSGAQCAGAVAPIQQSNPGPLLYGH